jgi:hypothetical protein
MYQRASQSQHRQEFPAALWVERVRRAAGVLWENIRATQAAYRQYRVAERLHAELAKLPDAELAQRRMARRDLHRIAWEAAETWAERTVRR